MPLILPARITREFANAHPELTFLYSNDYLEKGIFGQAWHLGGTEPRLPNCFRIPTLYKFCANPVYWTNSAENHRREIDECFRVIPQDRRIIALRKIGMGGSRCHELAPEVFKYIVKRIEAISYKDIVWQD